MLENIIPKEPLGDVIIYGREDDRSFSIIRASSSYETMMHHTALLRPLWGVGGEQSEPILFYVKYPHMSAREFPSFIRDHRFTEVEEINIGYTKGDVHALEVRLAEYYEAFVAHLRTMPSSRPISAAEVQVIMNNLNRLLKE